MSSTKWIWFAGAFGLAACFAIAESWSASRKVDRVEVRISKNESDLREVRTNIDSVSGKYDDLGRNTEKLLKSMEEMRTELVAIRNAIESMK